MQKKKNWFLFPLQFRFGVYVKQPLVESCTEEMHFCNVIVCIYNTFYKKNKFYKKNAGLDELSTYISVLF